MWRRRKNKPASSLAPGRPFELRVDGHLHSSHKTYRDAQQAADMVDLERHTRWDVAENIHGRRFNRAFGYRCGTTSTRDLAAMGVPISPTCLSDDA